MCSSCSGMPTYKLSCVMMNGMNECLKTKFLCLSLLSLSLLLSLFTMMKNVKCKECLLFTPPLFHLSLMNDDEWKSENTLSLACFLLPGSLPSLWNCLSQWNNSITSSRKAAALAEEAAEAEAAGRSTQQQHTSSNSTQQRSSSSSIASAY